jgi:hypothetical protein
MVVNDESELDNGCCLMVEPVKDQAKPKWARSTGARKELGELLGWFHISEGLAGPVV